MKNAGMSWKYRMLLALAFLLVLAGLAFASSAGPGITADQAVAKLKEGNTRFISGKPSYPNQNDKRRQETATGGQHPFVTVLACSDSRGPVELLFDQGVGDVFVIRVAGNVADTDELGTIEYGADHLGTPLVVVLGHTKCGAVTAVTEGAEVHGHIPKLVDNIVPAAQKVKEANPDKPAKELVSKVIVANVLQAMSDILTKSDILAGLARNGKLQVVGAIYDIESGSVSWLGRHPEEAKLLAK